MRKKIIIHISIIAIILTTFLGGYLQVAKMPIYATDNWTQVTTNEQLVEAFKYYCKSRDLSIEGSALDAITSFTTKTYQELCNKLGLDINAIQADLKYRTDSNGKLQFLFNQSGLSTYNRLFSQFLQDNDLSVGESVDDKNVYNGYSYNNNLVYVIRAPEYKGLWQLRNNQVTILQEGTQILTGDYFYANRPSTINLNGTNYSLYTSANSGSDYEAYITATNPNNYIIDTDPYGIKGFICYIYNSSTNELFLGQINIAYGTSYHGSDNEFKGRKGASFIQGLNADDKVASNVYVTTNNNAIAVEQTINQGDSITITNEGDTIINEGTENPDPENPDPENPDPENPDPENPSGGTDIDIDFPNLDFPNIPDIDFHLDGITAKFPFCIPFDIVALLGLLNAEPQAPHIEGTIPFGSWFTWELDFDFSRFDDFATLMRGFELVGFIFFLVGATIHIVKG